MAVLVIVLVVGAVLWLTGALDWLRMAGSFAASESGAERRELWLLRLKLGILRGLAREIGRTEAAIGERERSHREADKR